MAAVLSGILVDKYIQVNVLEGKAVKSAFYNHAVLRFFVFKPLFSLKTQSHRR